MIRKPLNVSPSSIPPLLRVCKSVSPPMYVYMSEGYADALRTAPACVHHLFIMEAVTKSE